MPNPSPTYKWRAPATIFVAAACAGLSFFALGCQRDDNNRRAVYGNVTSGGQPIAEGSISFYPGPDHSGPVANASIADGQYRFSDSTGPAAGPYHVVVKFMQKSEDGKTDAAGPPSKFPPPGAVTTPSGQGQQREFDVEVPQDQELRLDFDVLP